MANEFFAQYKDPRWQQKRLEALNAAEFYCQICFDGENELHVHHRRYVKGRKVWEYDVSELSVLCNGCHEHAHDDKEVLQSLIARIDPQGIDEIIQIISGYCLNIIGPASTDLQDGITYTCNGLPAKASVAAAAIVNTFDKDLAQYVYEAVTSRDGKKLSKYLSLMKKV